MLLKLTTLGLLLCFVDLVLRLFLFLLSSLQELFCIFAGHLRLFLLLLLLLFVLLFLLLLLLLLLLFFFLLVVLPLLVILVLLILLGLVLQLVLAEREVVARLIVLGVLTECIFVALDGLLELLLTLEDNARVVLGLRLALRVLLQTDGTLVVLHCFLRLTLREESVAEVVVGGGVGGIFLYSLLVIDLRFGK